MARKKTTSRKGAQAKPSAANKWTKKSPPKGKANPTSSRSKKAAPRKKSALPAKAKSKAKPKRASQPKTSKKIDRVAESSPDFKEEVLDRLREVVPEGFTEGKIDVDKLQELFGEQVEDRTERYTFTWAGKRDAIAILQAPTSATLQPVPKESVSFEDAEHVFIEGENLEVLKVVYRSYFGRVKMIYIDPPYNTGKDFIYPDNFSDPLDHYLRITGQINDSGDYLTSNPERAGRMHSAWLSMMYPRLSIVKQLLREDGVILVSIDDFEAYNLRRLMNDIFGNYPVDVPGYEM